MRCEEVLPLLTSFLEGDLPEELADEVRAHLNHCVDCWFHLLLVQRKRVKIVRIQSTVTFVYEVWQ